jgi:hypothetical protein
MSREGTRKTESPLLASPDEVIGCAVARLGEPVAETFSAAVVVETRKVAPRPPDPPPAPGAEARELEAAGREPKERCGKTIWANPQTGLWYSEEMALELLRLEGGTS